MKKAHQINISTQLLQKSIMADNMYQQCIVVNGI